MSPSCPSESDRLVTVFRRIDVRACERLRAFIEHRRVQGTIIALILPYAWACFVSFILVATFTVLNLFIAIIVSVKTRYPLVKTLLYNRSVLDVDRVRAELAARGNARPFEARLAHATWMLGGTFFFSAAMNYLLAARAVTSPAGSAAFNEELGRLTLLSYPVIALPSTLMMMFILYYLARAIHALTGLKFTDLLHSTKG